MSFINRLFGSKYPSYPSFNDDRQTRKNYLNKLRKACKPFVGVHVDIHMNFPAAVYYTKTFTISEQEFRTVMSNFHVPDGAIIRLEPVAPICQQPGNVTKYNLLHHPEMYTEEERNRLQHQMDELDLQNKARNKTQLELYQQQMKDY
jgi:hypothetical protein